MGKARAEIEVTASDSKLAAGLARARQKISEFSVSVARGTGATMSGAWSAVKWINKKTSPGATTKHAIGEFAGTMVTRGVDSLIGAAEGVRNFERSLVRYQIVANKTPESMKAFRDQVRGISRDTGVSSDAVLAGSQAYLDLTGDVAGAEKQMRTFARVAQASDSSMSDVTTLAAALQDSMHVNPSQMEAVMSGLINQGKAGAVTMKDMAGEFTGLLPRFARFGELGTDGVNKLGAMFQVGRKGFKSAEETGTGMAAMLGGLIKHADRFHKAGVDVFDIGKDGTKTLRPISKIIEEIGTSKLAKDPQLLNKAFGRGEGEQIYQMLKGHVDMLRQMEDAGRDAGTVQRDLTTFLESDAGRLDVTFNKLKETIATAFTPERITAFVNAVEQLADKLGPVLDKIGWVGDKLGALAGVGKSIRGAISGNGNPFAGYGDKWNEGGTSEDIYYKMSDAIQDGDTARANELAAHLTTGQKDYAAYNSTTESILGGEKDERTTPESIKRAVLASSTWSTTGTAADAGRLGETDAADTYLKNAGVTQEQQGKIWAEAFAAAAKTFASDIRDSMGVNGGNTTAVGGGASRPVEPLFVPAPINIDATRIDTATTAGSKRARRGKS